ENACSAAAHQGGLRTQFFKFAFNGTDFRVHRKYRFFQIVLENGSVSRPKTVIDKSMFWGRCCQAIGGIFSEYFASWNIDVRRDDENVFERRVIELADHIAAAGSECRSAV